MHQACYDMLASEARIATFLAVARGELPQQSWFKLARDYTYAFGTHVIISWTGTMFEYLMPALWMRSYPHTLIAKNLAAAACMCSGPSRARWEFRGAFPNRAPRNAMTAATMATTPMAFRRSRFSTRRRPGRSCRLTRLSLRSAWIRSRPSAICATWLLWAGWERTDIYEAADYTTESHNGELVREWMAHHQGMSLLAVVNTLCDDIVQEWFHANPLVQSAELLLHESPTSMADLKAMMKDFAAVPQKVGAAA